MNKISKNDLLKLRDSKPVPIIAHSHEMVIPVVYAGKVRKFLDENNIKIPLKKRELKELEDKAKYLKGTPDLEAYARGTKSLKSKIKIRKTKLSNVSKININIGNLRKTTRRRKKAVKKTADVSEVKPTLAKPTITITNTPPIQSPFLHTYEGVAKMEEPKINVVKAEEKVAPQLIGIKKEESPFVPIPKGMERPNLLPPRPAPAPPKIPILKPPQPSGRKEGDEWEDNGRKFRIKGGQIQQNYPDAKKKKWRKA